MLQTYIAMVTHAQGQQITSIEARDRVEARRRLKAKGYESILWIEKDE